MPVVEEKPAAELTERKREVKDGLEIDLKKESKSESPVIPPEKMHWLCLNENRLPAL